MRRTTTSISACAWMFALSCCAASPGAVAESLKRNPSSSNVSQHIVARTSYQKWKLHSPEGLVWCFDENPGFAFVSGKSVFLSAFDGPPLELLQAQKPLSPKSLRCNGDGNVVSVFTADGSELIVYRDKRWGHYDTGISSQHGFYLPGQLLSPDGRTIVLPANAVFQDGNIVLPLNVTHIGGDDVLSEMRLLRIDGEHFAWKGADVIFFDRLNRSISSYNILSGNRAILRKLDDVLNRRAKSLTGLGSCGANILVSLVPRGVAERAQGRIIAIPPQLKGSLPTDRMSSVTISAGSGVCIISRSESLADVEITRYDLVFEGRVVPFSVPRNLDIGYEVAIAQHGCLVRGLLYPDKEQASGTLASEDIVGLAIRGPHACAGN